METENKNESIDVGRWQSMLDSIDEKKPEQYVPESARRVSLYRLMEDAYPIFRKKLGEGWTVAQLAEMVRQETGLTFKDMTFRNYLNRIRKQQPTGKKRPGRKPVSIEKKENAKAAGEKAEAANVETDTQVDATLVDAETDTPANAPVSGESQEVAAQDRVNAEATGADAKASGEEAKANAQANAPGIGEKREVAAQAMDRLQAMQAEREQKMNALINNAGKNHE